MGWHKRSKINVKHNLVLVRNRTHGESFKGSENEGGFQNDSTHDHLVGASDVGPTKSYRENSSSKNNGTSDRAERAMVERQWAAVLIPGSIYTVK